MRVYLHQGHDGEPGVEAWVPELMGFATWGRQGNEILLPGDEIPAEPADIAHAVRLLCCSRADLIAEIDGAPEGLLDWDPPYRFAPWATWRTVRATRVAVVDHGFGAEHWSVRKALRRLFRHEILHWKSIRRICAEDASSRPAND